MRSRTRRCNGLLILLVLIVGGLGGGKSFADAYTDLNARVMRLYQQGKYAEAAPVAEQALALSEKMYPEGWQVAAALNNLAEIRRAQSMTDAAEPLYQRALQINEKVFGADNAVYANVLNNLALLYDTTGRYGESEKLLKRALAINEKQLGPEHEKVVINLNNLASLYARLGITDKAEPLFERALAISKKRGGRDSSVLNNLANLYEDQARYADSERLHLEAIEAARKEFGPEHPNFGIAVNNLGSLYKKTGRLDEAAARYQQARAILEKTLGPDHPEIATVLNNIAHLHESHGELDEAEKLYVRALAMDEKMLGDGNITVAVVRENLGGFYKARGNFPKARSLLERALQVEEKVYGATNPALAGPLSQLAELSRLGGDCGSAERMFRRAHDVGGKALTAISIAFGTDRLQQATPQVAFGPERGKAVSTGYVLVSTARSSASARSAPGNGSGGETSEAQRLALHCIELTKTPRKAEPAEMGRDALVFVHGYNVSFENAVRRAAQIAEDIEFAGTVYVFSWPSHERMTDYFSDRETVDLAAEHLRDFLESTVLPSKPRRIHFVAHSMGNMVLLRALAELAGERPDFRSVVGEVIDAAPDIDPDVYAQFTRKIAGPREDTAPRKFTLYGARNDFALRVSGWFRGRARAGFIDGKPLIADGVDTIDISEAGRTAWYDVFALNHDIYTASPAIVADMRRLITSGTRPPDKRTTEFEPVKSPEGTYWRFRPTPVTGAIPR